MTDALGRLGFGVSGLARVGERIRATAALAELMVDECDVRLPPNVLGEHAERGVADAAAAANDCDATPARTSPSLWNRERTLVRFAGVAMITPRWRWSPRASGPAFTAKALFQCQQDILDDLVDRGSYDFEAALRLYHLAAEGTTRGYDPDALRERFSSILLPEHRGLATSLAAATSALQRKLRESPNGANLRRTMNVIGQSLALSQAGMAFLRTKTWAPRRFRGLGERVAAPDADLPWDARLACAMTWTLTHALIDLCFVEGRIPTHDLAATIKAWSYLSGTITYLDHAVGLEDDLRNGIANAALVSMRPSEILGCAAFPRTIGEPEDAEYDGILRLAAEFTRRAFSTMAGRDDALYSSLAVMIPATLLTPWRGPRPDLVRRYVRRIAPAVRAAELRAYHSATYSQHASPSRTHAAFVTFPGNPRHPSTPS